MVGLPHWPQDLGIELPIGDDNTFQIGTRGDTVFVKRRAGGTIITIATTDFSLRSNILPNPSFEHQLFEVRVRCTHLPTTPQMAVGNFRFKDGCEERAASWPKYYFVGLNGTQLHPVTIEVPKDDAACGTKDDFHGAQFRQVGTGVMSGGNTIPHQAMGVPNNLAVIKSILDSTHGSVADA